MVNTMMMLEETLFAIPVACLTRMGLGSALTLLHLHCVLCRAHAGSYVKAQRAMRAIWGIQARRSAKISASVAGMNLGNATTTAQVAAIHHHKQKRDG